MAWAEMMYRPNSKEAAEPWMSHECCFCAKEIGDGDPLAVRVAISNLNARAGETIAVQEAYAHADCMSRCFRPGFVFDGEALSPDSFRLAPDESGSRPSPG